MIDFFATARGNANVMHFFLKSLMVKVTSPTSYSCLHEHPNYPSLLSFSDCLKEWKVANNAYNISREDYNPAELSFPLLAHIKDERAKFIVIHQIKDGKVTFSDERKRYAIMPEEEFLKVWDGIVLHAEPSSKSGEADYREKHTKNILSRLRWPLLVCALLSFVGYLFAKQEFSWPYASITTITAIGTVISIFLLMYSIDANNPLLQNLCSLGNKNDCNAILKSDSANVTSWLTWSEVGFFYFAGSLLSILFLEKSLPVLAMLNICCLPYTIWSIWYQNKAKNWCVLCCSVQLVIWLQFIVFITSIDKSLSRLDLSTFIGLVACFGAPILLWTFAKPTLAKAEQLSALKQQINKFKFNADLFNQLLTRQTKFHVPDELLPVVFGNTNAPVTITLISNPFCGPCGSAHNLLDEWLEIRDDIKVNILFTAASNESSKIMVAKHLTGLSLLEDKMKVAAAINEWYNVLPKDYEAWAKKYPISVNQALDELVAKQNEWFNLVEVSFTPTILVNGYRLPDPYRLKDLKYFLN